MNAETAQIGEIITFYSFKGGTGRSMALANTACLLGRRLAASSQRVLIMDWDLEAPGLHRYFAGKADQPESAAFPGLINYFDDLRRLLDERQELAANLNGQDAWRGLDDILPISRYIIRDVAPGVDLIKAGRFDAQYAGLVGGFNWVDFFYQYGALLQVFRDLLAAQYAYCLIDSRTGLTDVSGICTMILPEKLVAVFTPNRQSLYGLVDLVRQASEYRRSSNDFRPLSVFPLPSRIELAEKTLREEWRAEYESTFENLFREVYDLAECDLTAYFDDIQIPHMSYYAYGENIAVLEERSEALSLRRAYEVFFQRLVSLDFAWDTLDIYPSSIQPRTDYALLNIRIRGTGPEYTVDVQSSLGGDATGTFKLPTTNLLFQELVGKLQMLETDEDQLVELGSILFTALFQGRLKEVYARSQGRLAANQGLRLRLDLDPQQTEIAALPWEFLYDPDQGPLALLDMPVVRYLPQQAATPNLTVPLPLKILVTAAVTQPALEVERELAQIKSALAGPEQSGVISVQVEEHLTQVALQRRLREGFQVWHFVGHGGWSRDGKTGTLLFEDGTGSSKLVSASELNILLNRSGMRLIVLDACDSTKLAIDPYRSIAPALVRAQVPAVIAMQFSVPQEATGPFVGELYRALAEGFPIDACLTEGRKAVMNETGLRNPDWGLPIVYTRVPDGRLFEFTQAPTAFASPLVATTSSGSNIQIGSINISGSSATYANSSPAANDEHAEQTARFLELIKAKRRRLFERQLQAAKFGVSADPSLMVEVEDLTREIDELQRQVKNLGAELP